MGLQFASEQERLCMSFKKSKTIVLKQSRKKFNKHALGCVCHSKKVKQ